MARGVMLAHLLGVCLLLAKFSETDGLPQPSRHVDSPEDSNNVEFRSNSMGVTKVIDLRTGTIAYKDHILKSCYIEKISSQSVWEKNRVLLVHPRLLTNTEVGVIGGPIVANFCFGLPSKILRHATNVEVRSKRSNKPYYFVARKARGQTQSQYLQFGNGEAPGRAEAEATRQGSKATVYGTRGMGQAQSQSDPFSCADCFGAPGFPGSTTQFGPESGLGQLSGGRQFDASGRPITNGRPGFGQTDAFGRPIGAGAGGRDGDRVTQIGRGPTTGQQLGGQQGGPGQLLQTPNGRLIHPGQIGGAPGTTVQPGQGITGGPGGGVPGQLLTPDGRIIHPGRTDQTGGAPGTTIHTRPGQTGGLQLPGAPGVPDSFEARPGQIGGLPGSIGGPGTPFQTRPGETVGLPGTTGRPGIPIQTHPGQIGGLPGTTGGPGIPLQIRPGQAGDLQGITSGPGTTGGPGIPSDYVPGQTGTGQIGFQPGTTGGPGTSITHPGQTIGGPGIGLYRPGQGPIGGIQQGPGTSTFFTPGSLQTHPVLPGRPGTGIQTYPGGDLSGQRGQAPGSLQTRPGIQIYDHGGLHRPSGQPVHPGDVGPVSPTGQIQQGGPQGGDITQPGQTTYYIPGGIRPRPGDSSYGYYPSPSAPGGRIPTGGAGTQDGTFQGHVAGEYRPASGTGGEFSGSFQGTYHPHGGESVSGVYDDRTPQGFYPGGRTGDQLTGQGGTRWPQRPGVLGEQIPGTITTGTQGVGPGQFPGGIQTGQETYIPGQLQIPSGSQTTGGEQTWGQPGFQQGTGLQPGQISTGVQPGQPGYQQGGGLLPGQQPTQYPSGAGQPGYQQGTGLSPGYPGTSGTGAQIPGQEGGAGYIPGQISTGGRQPGYQQGVVGQYPGQPGYQQGGGLQPGQFITGRLQPGQITTEGQYPGQPGYQQGTGLIPGQISTGGIGGVGQPGYQQGIGLLPGEQQTGVSQYPSGAGQPGYQLGTGLVPGYPGTSGTGVQMPGQQVGITAPGQQIYGQQPGISGEQRTGTGGISGGPTYGPQQGERGQAQYGQQGGQITGPGGIQDGRTVYQGGVSAPGGQQIGQYQTPGALLSGQAGQESDDSNTQAQSTIQRADNETQASASSSGRYAGGTAQSQVSGSYAGTGSFSASAGTNDGLRGAQTQVSGNSEGTLSSSQGLGGRAKSQAQVQLSADTGDTQSSAQTSGLNHGTNTQVQSGIKGGMADAQANGPGSTSSQAQIGFTPYDATNNNDDPVNPHNGGGTASASSGTHAGKSQVQINGKYAFGIRYTGQSQASSANSGYTADTINLPTMRPIDFSNDPYSKSAKQEKVNVRQIDDPSLIKIITTSTTPTPDEDEDEYDEYEDPEPPPPPPNSRQNLVQQAKTRSLMHDALDPLEDIDDHGVDVQGQLKHGDVIQTGHFIPGSTGYKIPPGFRGRVREDPVNHETTPIYVAGANANRRGYHEGYGSGYTYQPRYSPVQYGFKSSNQAKNFVSMTKSETGSRNIITGKKTPSVYYTQSSTCGYFTNTCVYSNGRKICLPKPKANPDGTPIICRN